MTRKDYVALAAAIRKVDNRARLAQGSDVYDDPVSAALIDRERQTVAAIVEGLSATLAADNPAFDADRFAAACGVRS